jgi:hypothetical protein
MFRWFTDLFRSYTVEDCIERLAPGHKEQMALYYRGQREKDAQWNKRQLFEQQLEDAEWILEYEKRLIGLQKKTAAQRSLAEQAGANTERLRRLEHQLAGLRRNLSLG